MPFPAIAPLPTQLCEIVQSDGGPSITDATALIAARIGEVVFRSRFLPVESESSSVAYKVTTDKSLLRFTMCGAVDLL